MCSSPLDTPFDDILDPIELRNEHAIKMAQTKYYEKHYGDSHRDKKLEKWRRKALKFLTHFTYDEIVE